MVSSDFPYTMTNSTLRSSIASHSLPQCRETHRLAAAATIPVAALAEEPFIAATRSAEPGFYNQCIAVFAEHGVAPNIVEESNAASAILGMVAMGLGVTVSPQSLLTMPRVGVICRPLEASSVVLELGVARQTEPHSAALNAFLQVVGEIAAATEMIPFADRGASLRMTNVRNRIRSTPHRHDVGRRGLVTALRDHRKLTSARAGRYAG